MQVCSETMGAFANSRSSLLILSYRVMEFVYASMVNGPASSPCLRFVATQNAAYSVSQNLIVMCIVTYLILVLQHTIRYTSITALNHLLFLPRQLR
jgi:hypothetical protein